MLRTMLLGAGTAVQHPARAQQAAQRAEFRQRQACWHQTTLYPSVLEYIYTSIKTMQQALLFAQSVRALQRAKAWSPDVSRRIMHWGGSHSDGSASASRSSARARSSVAPSASAQDLSSAAIAEAQQPAAPQPATPLCERPAEHTAPLPDLLAWREAAEQQVAAVGTSWEREDDGPSVEDLQVGGPGPARCLGLRQRYGACSWPSFSLAAFLWQTSQSAAPHWVPTPCRCTQTELGWLLDDALTAMARPGSGWRPTSWRQLERDLRQRSALREAACQYLVQLREPLEALGERQCWRFTGPAYRSCVVGRHMAAAVLCVHWASGVGERCPHGHKGSWLGLQGPCRPPLDVHASSDCPLPPLCRAPLSPLQRRCGTSECRSVYPCSTSHPPHSGGTWCCQVTAPGTSGGCPARGSLPTSRPSWPAAARGSAAPRPSAPAALPAHLPQPAIAPTSLPAPGRPAPAVGPGVLIPRPETELMIDFVEEAARAAPELGSGAWADLGTGSGALAVGVARALPQAQQV